MSTKQDALATRLKIFERQESYIYLSSEKWDDYVKFGFILTIKPDDKIIFMEDSGGVFALPMSAVDRCEVFLADSEVDENAEI